MDVRLPSLENKITATKTETENSNRKAGFPPAFLFNKGLKATFCFLPFAERIHLPFHLTNFPQVIQYFL